MDISARFADDDEKEKFRADGFTSVPIEDGELFYPEAGIALSDSIRLGLLKFLWGSRITVRGVRAQ